MSASITLIPRRQSIEWTLVERVVDDLVDVDDEQIRTMTIQFCLATLARSECACQMSILMDSDSGSIAFVEDRFGNAWLAQWTKGTSSGHAWRIEPLSDTELISQQCIHVLTGPSETVQSYWRPH